MPRYRVYDHRLKQAVFRSRNPYLFPELAIPRSTALGWIKRGVPEVVTTEELDLGKTELLVRCQDLKRERNLAMSTQKLTSFTFKLFGLQIQFKRLPRGDDKVLLLTAVKSAANALGLSAALHAIGLSAARFAAWSRKQRECDLDDYESCPKTSPTKLLPSERQTIRKYAGDKKLAHLSTTSLSWLAMRRGELFASASTWCKLVRREKLRTLLPRIYPAAPKIGVRAVLPCDIWHIDVSIIRLLDGTKAFIQAIVDNASRFIVAHQVGANYGGLCTKALLESAIATAKRAGYHAAPNVWCDSGVENLNSNVDALIGSNAIQRTVAQIDISQSNSMVEAFFRRLKHAWLFVHPLPDLESAARLTAQYVKDHNELIPHYALAGATPGEIFLGRWSPDTRTTIETSANEARASRAIENRSQICNQCISP